MTITRPPAARPPVAAIEGHRLTRRGVLLAVAMVILMVGMTQAMTIRAQAADVGGSSPPVAPTYLLFLWALLSGAGPAALRRRFRLTRQDVLVAYCAAMISGPIAHEYAIGFLVPHMVAPYYYGTGWERFYPWLPSWLGPRDPAVVRAFFLGSGGHVPWGAWFLPVFAWTVLLAALFLATHCAMILLRRPWLDHERLSFPLAQIPLGLASDGGSLPSVLRSRLFWIGLLLAMALETPHRLHGYLPSSPDLALRPLFEYDFAANMPGPCRGLGLLELRLSPWLVAIVALLPAEIAFSGWFFFWVTRAEDVSALYFGATDLPNVYSNEYPALYSQGAGAAYALAALAIWGARRHLARAWRAAGRDEFGSPRFALLGLVLGVAVMIGWLWLAGMRWWVAALLISLMLGYFLIFARVRGEAGLSMGVILWPKMLDEVMLTLCGSRMLRPADLTLLYSLRWLYFGASTGGVMACQLESFKITGEAGLRDSATGRLLLLVALLAVPIALFWTLHTYHGRGFVLMPIGNQELSMVGSQVYWSYANLMDALKNPAGPDPAGMAAMGTGAGIALALATLRSRFLWWPLHPIGYMAANSWGMHWNWGSLTLGWLIKVLLLRYGGLRTFRQAVPCFIGLVVGDMLNEGLWGAFAAWVALAPV